MTRIGPRDAMIIGGGRKVDHLFNVSLMRRRFCAPSPFLLLKLRARVVRCEMSLLRSGAVALGYTTSGVCVVLESRRESRFRTGQEAVVIFRGRQWCILRVRTLRTLLELPLLSMGRLIHSEKSVSHLMTKDMRQLDRVDRTVRYEEGRQGTNCNAQHQVEKGK